jgi:hypothetical protein
MLAASVLTGKWNMMDFSDAGHSQATAPKTPLA